MRLTTFLALGAIVGVDLDSPKDPRKRTKNQKSQHQRQSKQCVQKDWDYPARGGRLTQIVTHLSKICKGYIDRPNYQCRCLKRQKTLFWSLVKARRVCISRKRQADRQSEKNQRKAESNRNRREEEERVYEEDEDMIMDEDTDVQDADANAHLDEEADLANALEEGGEITGTAMDTLIAETCDATDDTEDAEEECSNLREAADDLRSSGDDEEAKERAEIMFRIIRMHKAMGNWAETYVAQGSFCDKQDKLTRRIKKNRRRMQKKRKAYPTNPTKLKRKRQDDRKQEQDKKEKQAARAARTD